MKHFSTRIFIQAPAERVIERGDGEWRVWGDAGGGWSAEPDTEDCVFGKDLKLL